MLAVVETSFFHPQNAIFFNSQLNGQLTCQLTMDFIPYNNQFSYQLFLYFLSLPLKVNH